MVRVSFCHLLIERIPTRNTIGSGGLVNGLQNALTANLSYKRGGEGKSQIQ